MWEAITFFLALPLLFVIGQFYCRLAVWSFQTVALACQAWKDRAGLKGHQTGESLP
jgi:hypothetical protein